MDRSSIFFLCRQPPLLSLFRSLPPPDPHLRPPDQPPKPPLNHPNPMPNPNPTFASFFLRTRLTTQQIKAIGPPQPPYTPNLLPQPPLTPTATHNQPLLSPQPASHTQLPPQPTHLVNPKAPPPTPSNPKPQHHPQKTIPLPA